MLTRISKPLQSAVTLEKAKLHTRVDLDVEDSVLATYLASAIGECAQYASRALEQCDYRLTLDDWSCEAGGVIPIPIAPLVAVDSVKYLDEADSLVTVDAADWGYQVTPGGGYVYFADGYSFPSLVTGKPGRVQIELTAGYDADDGSSGVSDPELEMPAPIVQAILVTFAHYYANRESVTAGKTPVVVPRAAEWLLDFYRIYR